MIENQRAQRIMMIFSCMIGTVGLFIIASTDSSNFTTNYYNFILSYFSKNELDIRHCLLNAWFACTYFSFWFRKSPILV